MGLLRTRTGLFRNRLRPGGCLSLARCRNGSTPQRKHALLLICRLFQSPFSLYFWREDHASKRSQAKDQSRSEVKGSARPMDDDLTSGDGDVQVRTARLVRTAQRLLPALYQKSCG